MSRVCPRRGTNRICGHSENIVGVPTKECEGVVLLRPKGRVLMKLQYKYALPEKFELGAAPKCVGCRVYLNPPM